MNQIKKKVGSFTAASTAAAQYIELGFVPDVVRIFNETSTADKVAQVEWQSSMGAGFIKHTLQADNGSTGHKTAEWVASGGLTTSNTTVKKPAAWLASTAYAVGDIVHPTTNNNYFYKCKTAGTSHSAEPTWLTVVGGDTSEGGGTAVWTCYNMADLPVEVAAKVGMTIPAIWQIDSVKCHWVAERINA